MPKKIDTLITDDTGTVKISIRLSWHEADMLNAMMENLKKLHAPADVSTLIRRAIVRFYSDGCYMSANRTVAYDMQITQALIVKEHQQSQEAHKIQPEEPNKKPSTRKRRTP